MDGKTTQSAASDGLNWGGDMSGDELRNIVLRRYGRLYDARICQRRDRFNKLQIYLQIMWKFLGQKSFPLSEAEYVEQTDSRRALVRVGGRGRGARSAAEASEGTQDGHDGSKCRDDSAGFRRFGGERCSGARTDDAI